MASNLVVCAKTFSPQKKTDSTAYYSHLANNPKNSSSLVQSYVYFNKQYESNLTAGDTIPAVNNLRQLAIIQFGLGDYFGSETNAVKALKLLENLKENKITSECKVGIYNQLGRIHYTLLNYNEALKHFQKALKHASNENQINIIRNNIGLIYIDESNFEKAENEFQDIYTNSLTLNNAKQTARALDNLGLTKLKLGKQEALDILKDALQIRLKIADQKGLYSSYKNLSIYYKKHQDKPTTQHYAQKAYNTAKKLNSASFLEDALSHWMSLSPNPMILQYQKLKDSIDTSRQMAENKYALIKFNYAKQEQIAQENKIKQEKERADKIMYQGIGGLILISSVFAFLIIKVRHKKDKIKTVYHTESRISKKVHDELANDVYQIMSKLQNNTNIQDDILDDLDLVYSKTRDISKENSSIDLNDDYQTQLKELFASYSTHSVNVITRGMNTINWHSFDNIKKITLYRVLQELLVNMKKHSQCNNAIISFKKINNKTHINYADNGKVCVFKKGSGMRNMENRIKSINGTISFESEPNKGFKAKISV
nr:tetratricopeptide repeat-containing sensor histidine kinase [Tamlana crocina]